jgi:hypothetical protein
MIPWPWLDILPMPSVDSHHGSWNRIPSPREQYVMAKKNAPARISPELLERQIYIVRGQRVMLDADLAKLYGTMTMALNQAVKRNADRFPSDFAYQLTQKELTDLISQIVISNPQHGPSDLRSQIATSSGGHGGRRKLPWVFTEQGVAMLSSVLRSPTAVKVNIEIMRAFVRLRRLLATPGELVAQIAKLAETVELHDEQIKVITEVLRKMMEPPPPAPRRPIGFQASQTGP